MRGVLVMVIALGNSACGDYGPFVHDVAPSVDGSNSGEMLVFRLERAIVTGDARVDGLPLDAAPRLLGGQVMIAQPDGSWTAANPGDPPYAVQFMLDGGHHVWVTSSLNINGTIIRHGYDLPPVTPTAQGTKLAFDVALSRVSNVDERYVVALPGLTSVPVEVSAPTAQLVFEMDWSNRTPIGMQDAVVIARYDGSGRLDGVLKVPAFSQTLVSTPITGTLETASMNRDFGAFISSGIATQYASLSPPFMPTGELAYRVQASPYGRPSEQDIDGVPLVRAATISSATVMIGQGFANPFEARGWPAIFSIRGAATRSSAGLMGGAPEALHAGFTLDTLASEVPPIESPALPSNILLDGAPIIELEEVARAPGVTVEATCGAGTTAYRYTLYNTLGRFGGATGPRRVAELLTPTPSVTIPASLFLPADPPSPWWYFVRVECLRGGLTNIANGDFSTFTLPYATSYVDSPVFVCRPA
ncbi:MAG: hypothetical protein SFX73_19875 [Kofleriaceae bacterium]|nr:hypothetical protein [Kofleriaceae bacterium]